MSNVITVLVAKISDAGRRPAVSWFRSQHCSFRKWESWSRKKILSVSIPRTHGHGGKGGWLLFLVRQICGLIMNWIELNWWAYVVTWCLKFNIYAHMHACTQMNVVHNCFVLWDQVSCAFPQLQSVLSSKFWRFHDWMLQWYSRRFHWFQKKKDNTSPGGEFEWFFVIILLWFIEKYGKWSQFDLALLFWMRQEHHKVGPY